MTLRSAGRIRVSFFERASWRLRPIRRTESPVPPPIPTICNRFFDIVHPEEKRLAAAAGDELGILDPLDAGAEDVGGHRTPPGQAGTGAALPARITAAASRIAATMLW